MRFISVLKPGIIFGNIITVCGGFFLGSVHRSHFSILLLLFCLIGMALIVGSGCVFNNVIDRDIDQLMERTCHRPMVQGLIHPTIALVYGTALGLLGFWFLYFTTNLLTLNIAMLGWFFYVVVYSLWLKRRSTWGTLLGSISGAVPPVVGYCAAANQLDLGALSLFLILFFWQMPHFYAIAIYRLKDFKSANIPVLPAIKSLRHTQITMLIYMGLYLISTLLPFLFQYTGYVYLLAALILGLAWIFYGLQGFKTQDEIKNKKWAKKIFLFSILDITLLSLLMGLNLII